MEDWKRAILLGELDDLICDVVDVELSVFKSSPQFFDTVHRAPCTVHRDKCSGPSASPGGLNNRHDERDSESQHGAVLDAGVPALQRLVFGNLAHYDLGPPQNRLSDLGNSSGPTVDSGFVDDVKNGRINVRAAVIGLDRTQTLFAEGPPDKFDSIVCATGYNTGLADILDSSLLAVDNEWPLISNQGKQRGLHFIGFSKATLTSFLPDFAGEATSIAAAIAGS